MVYSIASIVCKRRYCFGGYPGEEDTDDHIDGKIDCNVHRIVHAGAVKVIVEEQV